MRRQPSPGRGRPRGWFRPFEERGGRAAAGRPRHPLHGGHRHRDAAQRARRPCQERVRWPCPARAAAGASSWWTTATAFRAALHERVFEPRVTSKLDTMHLDKWGVHGRGMALYSIAVNAETARVAASDAGLGSSLHRGDRPGTRGGEGRPVQLSRLRAHRRGDRGRAGAEEHSAHRACEFALECRRDCTVYLGSVTDVVATLYAFGLSSLTRGIACVLGRCRRAARVQAPGPRRRPGGARGHSRVAGAGPVRAFGAPRAGRRDSAAVPSARPRAHRQRRSRACSRPRSRSPVRLRRRAGSQSWPARIWTTSRARWPPRTATSRNATTWSPTCSPRCAWARTASASISP